jgi:hypothetical protein
VFRPGRGANLRELVKHGMPALEGHLAGRHVRLAVLRTLGCLTSSPRENDV